MVIIFNSVFSQEIILTFIPASDTLTIDSIQATNLVTNESLSVAGGESVNLNDITTGANEFELISDNSLIYPNPFQDYTTLQYATSKKETIRLRMINSAGASVAIFKQHLIPGSHQFKITTKSTGIYFINIQSGETSISHKLVSLTKGSQDRIEHSSVNGEIDTKKSLKVTQTEQVIHFKIYSGDNVTIIADNPTESKTYEVEFYECKDADGQHYPIVQIGDQWWMVKNLAISAGNGSWVYNNSASNLEIYGRLYNWEAAKSHCPTGWYLPSDADWTKLENYLVSDGYNYDGSTIGNKVAKSLAARTIWNSSPSVGAIGNDLTANNKSGFAALPGGYRTNTAVFGGIGDHGAWWSSTLESDTRAWGRYLHYSEEFLNRLSLSINNGNGFGVRCLRK